MKSTVPGSQTGKDMYEDLELVLTNLIQKVKKIMVI